MMSTATQKQDQLQLGFLSFHISVKIKVFENTHEITDEIMTQLIAVIMIELAMFELAVK